MYSDRYIPSRLTSNFEDAFDHALKPGPLDLKDEGAPADGNRRSSGDTTSTPAVARENQHLMNSLIRSELLGQSSGGGGSSADKLAERSHVSPALQFKSTKRSAADRHSAPGGSSIFPMSPARDSEEFTPKKAKRKIAKVPFKVLDAPSLQDDFYLNLVDWSSTNVLAVGLGSCVYLWSACTSRVTKLCELNREDSVTSVSWAQQGNQICVGTSTGKVKIWDAMKCKHVRDLESHEARVGALAWNGTTVASGSRDRKILLQDMRARGGQGDDASNGATGECVIRTWDAHRQEVCGLKWSFTDTQLASGGNDNKLYVWDMHSDTPICRFSEHTAAVKAIAWSPHQHGLLASGGGTADRCIRFWNTLNNSPVNKIDTGSQVCNLIWSKNVNEIVSTHGYSLNQVIVWRYPSMSKVATLTGHTFRVLYLAMSPDGQTIVTGAGDETLRFWNVFPGPRNRVGSRIGTSLLIPSGGELR